jgi:uncharacterized membrane protein YebE (DUF533 family)
MKKVITILTVAALAGMVAAQPVFAGRIGNRQANQDKRICQGIESGELTIKETRQLKRQQRLIRKHKRMAMADGSLTGKERVRLERQLDKAGKNIYRLKHNNRCLNCRRAPAKS